MEVHWEVWPAKTLVMVQWSPGNWKYRLKNKQYFFLVVGQLHERARAHFNRGLALDQQFIFNNLIHKIELLVNKVREKELGWFDG